MAKASNDRKQLYKDWRAVRLQMQSGDFDINNPLHVELEYSTCRRILDNSRVVSQQQQFKGYSYKDYIRRIKDKDKTLDRKEKAEIVYAAYEAVKLKEFIDAVTVQANSFGREVWVVPNLSLGRFSNVFIDGDLKSDDTDVTFAKIASTPLHNDPNYIDPRFMRSQVLHRIISERPVIIVVDSSKHLDRYPDAYQGYLNLAIALNDVISDGNVAQYADIAVRGRGSIHGFKGTSDFKVIRKTIQREYDSVSKKDPVLYGFHFWNPRDTKLKIRSERNKIGRFKPLNPEKLNNPAIIFVNTVLEDNDIPKEIKERVGGIHHDPGYFDDHYDCRPEHLLFKFDETGIHLSDAMHEAEMRAMAGLRGKKQRQKVLSRPRASEDNNSGKRLNVGSDLASTVNNQNAIKIRRLIDELDDNNSKIQSDAAASLGEYTGSESIASALRRTLLNRKNKPEVRYWAASSLGSLGLIESTPDLSKALLTDSSLMVKAEAARAIGKLGAAEAVPSLSEALDKNRRDRNVKQEIILALRNIRVNEVLPVMLKVLKEDNDPVIRAMAAEAFLDVGREDVVPESLKYLSDENENVRTMLVEGLGDLSDTLRDLTKDVVESLCKLLLQDKSPMVRQKIAWALGQIGDISAFKVIGQALKSEWDSDVKEMLVWAKERLVKAKETTPAPKIGRAKVVPMEKKLPLIKETPTSQEAAQEKAKVITIQGAKIDLSKMHGYIFDLDGTLAPLGQPIPLAINEALIKLLKAGKQIAIVTAEREENLEARVWGQLPDDLRKGLHFYSNGGTRGFGFDSKGERVSYYNFILSEKDQADILRVVNSVLDGKPFTIEPADYKVKITLGRKILKQRHDIAIAMQESLKLAGIDATISFQDSTHINIHKFDKMQAVREFLSRSNLDEENLFIVADKAKSFGADRRILASFPKAVSINVGRASPTVQKENPNIIQTDVKNILATEIILNTVTGDSAFSLQEIASALPVTSYTDTEDESQMGAENELEAEADRIRQRYHGVKIGVIGATAPTKDYSPELGQELGRKLVKYISGKGFVFTGGVAGVGVDVHKGVSEAIDDANNRFFVLVPVAEKPNNGYGKVETAHIGIDKFERRIAMSKVADALIVLNGKGGTLHEAVSALENGTKLIALNHGGAGSLLYNAKANNVLSPELVNAGFKKEYLENIVLSDISGIEKALEQLLEEKPVDLVTAMVRRQKAIQKLTEKGKAVVPVLLDTIEKTNSLSQMEGLAEVLGKIEDIRALPVLQRLQQKHRSSLILEKAVMRLLSSANAQRSITPDTLMTPQENTVTTPSVDIKSSRIDPANLRNLKNRNSAIQKAA